MSTVRNRLRRAAILLWPLTLVGLVVGAAVGLLLASSMSRSSTASTLVRIAPPASLDQILTGAQPQSDVSQSYLADQLAYLSSEGFRLEAAQSAGVSEPVDLVATQEGQSTVVQISATADDRAAAAKFVDAALEAYRRHANDSFQQQVQVATAAIDKVTADIQADALAQAGGEGSAVDSATLSVRLEPLKVQKVSLQVAARRGVDIQVVSPTWVAEVVASPALGIVGGGVIGGAVALAGALWFRVRSGVLASADALEHKIGPVLRPVVKLTKQSGRLSAKEAGLARTLASQLPPPHDGRTIVVGATASSGASTVARLLGHAFSEHGSVATAQASEFAGMDRGQLRHTLQSIEESQAKEGATIVFGPSFATEPALTELLPLADRVVFVVQVGGDTADQVESMRRAVTGFEGPTVAVATSPSMFGSGYVEADANAEQVAPLPSDDGEQPRT